MKGLALVLMLTAGSAWAEAPAQSPRPPARPASVVAVVPSGLAASGVAASAEAQAELALAQAGPEVTATPQTDERVSSSGLVTSPRPLRRLSSSRPAPSHPTPSDLSRATTTAEARGIAVMRSPRPAARPESFPPETVIPAAALIPMQPDPRQIVGRRGTICGDPRLRGETVAPIASRVRGCGISDPVKVRQVSGLRLSAAATVDCQTARTLADWVDDSVKPAVGRRGGGAAELVIMASYACRPRNNQAGAKVSEHGRGRAVDIGGVVLQNGTTIRVLDHWRDRRFGPVLKAMHDGACGRFGTVLGPAADRFHQNHLHLDTARYRNGSYCR